jgi:hypothetical protein
MVRLRLPPNIGQLAKNQRVKRWFFVLAAVVCSPLTSSADSVDAVAEQFVEVGLRFQNHDPLPYIYLGPEQRRQAAKADPQPLAATLSDIRALRERLAALPATDDLLEQRRRRDLAERLVAVQTRGEILNGQPPASFDEETQKLFGVQAPHYSEAHFRELVAKLDRLIPGKEPLVERVASFRDRFIIPRDKLDRVIGRAMQECRARTSQQFSLPSNEAVKLNLTGDMPWVGFTEYKGDSQSIVHLNHDVPVHIERAIELGCHEGYPGHHVHASLIEDRLIKGRGWVEYNYISLVGPLAVVAEGAASFAMELAFTRQERMQFERDVLLPLAGLSDEGLETYYHYVDLIEQLNYARNEAARKYLFEGMPRQEAIEWLMEFGLETAGTAATRLNVIHAQRSYVVTYNFGRTMIANYLKSKGQIGTPESWQHFHQILTTPLSPRDLLPTTTE